MGSGGMIVLDEDNCMVDVATLLYGFYMLMNHVGKCTPCREGTKRMLGIVAARLREGQGEPSETLDELEHIGT